MPKPIRNGSVAKPKPQQAPGPAPLQPLWTLPGGAVRLYRGDSLTVLRRLPSQSVHCVVTSPPYWGLRDYGTGEWEGGKAGCDHSRVDPGKASTKSTINGGFDANNHQREPWPKGICGKCGATRIDQQLGSEATPQEYVDRMVAVFREVRRVLRDDGVCWLNLGDTMQGGGNMAGVPWRVALALQEDGWTLRQDVIWRKPSPMPESVTNRCTKAHEYVFLLTKGPKYWADMEDVREEGEGYGRSEWTQPQFKEGDKSINHGSKHLKGVNKTNTPTMEGGRNKRSVWDVPEDLWSQFLQWVDQQPPSSKADVWRISHGGGYAGAHFATFPPDLVEVCLRIGCPAQVCGACGKPWNRMVERGEYSNMAKSITARKGPEGANPYDQSPAMHKRGGGYWPTKTLGWEAGCKCKGANVVPGTLLDPFMGAGTSAAVALTHGRHAVGIDLSESYLRELAIPRIMGKVMQLPRVARLALPPMRKLEGKGLVSKSVNGAKP